MSFWPLIMSLIFVWLSSLVAQTVKRLSAMQETWVWSLGWEDALEKEMAAHSRTLAWKISWTEEPGRLLSMWLQRVRHDWATSFSLSFSSSYMFKNHMLYYHWLAFTYSLLSFFILLWCLFLLKCFCFYSLTTTDNYFTIIQQYLEGNFLSVGMTKSYVSL